MTSSKSVSWSALVNVGNNESLAITVSGEAANPDEARDIFAFACGQLLGVANSADEATAPLTPGIRLPARPDRGSAAGGAGRPRAGAEKGTVGAEDYQVVGMTRCRRRSRTQCPRHHPLRRSKQRRPSHSASSHR